MPKRTALEAADDPTQQKTRGSVGVRASVSFPRELYETLEKIAKQKKVSLAWVVRDATEQYVAEKWPLLPQ
jgi:metal-responsive CopG/Arc/MetJ family transcriptional regulator